MVSCFDSLKQHIKPENYQAAVWGRSVECNSFIPDPAGHGWSEDENSIDIVWNECSPSPNEVLYLLSCGCLKKCKVGTCSCLDRGLQCTDDCHIQECENMP